MRSLISVLGVVFPSILEFLFPVHPWLILHINIVFIDGVFVGERALHLSNVVVNLLTAVLIHGATDGPDETELEPNLYHASKVVLVSWVNLSTIWNLLILTMHFIINNSTLLSLQSVAAFPCSISVHKLSEWISELNFDSCSYHYWNLKRNRW